MTAQEIAAQKPIKQLYDEEKDKQMAESDRMVDWDEYKDWPSSEEELSMSEEESTLV